MNKPILLVVDDDPQVLAAVRRDLRSKYREAYTVMSAASGPEALATVRELKSRGDALAMMISDQRMPEMLGGELLARSREVYPLARRVLLTAYSGRLTLHHADLYRLGRPDEAEELGLEELPGPDGVLAVEWAERLGSMPWSRAFSVRLEHAGEDRRRVSIASRP